MITVSQQPQNYMPAFNPQHFTALSDQVGQPDFLYRVICTDLISSETQTYDIDPRPDDYCVFNAGIFTKSYFPNDKVTHNLPINKYGWQLATGVRKFRVNIGEYYSSTYASGTNIDFICWNGYIDFLTWPGFGYTDYVFNGPGSSVKYFTPLHNDKTFEDRGHMLFALTQNANEVDSIRIETFDVNGVQLGTSDIPNPNQPTTTYDERYFCIDVGHKGLKNISAPYVTGDYPIITDQVAYYIISDGSVLGSPGAGTITPIKRIDIVCEPRYDVYTIHYLRKLGDFCTIHFSKRSDTEISKEQSYYKQNPYQLVSGEYLYYGYDSVDKLLSSISQEKLKLNTDWMSEEEVGIHKDLIDSPVVYLDLGLGVPYPQLRIVSGTYRVNKSYNEKLFSIQMDFEYSHQNTRQV